MNEESSSHLLSYAVLVGVNGLSDFGVKLKEGELLILRPQFEFLIYLIDLE